MGLALAAAAAERGWPVTLLLGPAATRPPEDSHLTTIRFQTTDDLSNLLREHWPDHDLLIMAAAVADYRPVSVDPDGKHRRGDERLVLELEPTPDLLAGLAEVSRPGQVRVGFALEPADRLLESARDKLTRKGLDAIVANPLETMDADDVEATLLLADGRSIPTPGRLSKTEFAAWLLREIEEVVPFGG
jgi:phosphopantothenoylcysteine decarboxylase/phosphopantothenate--cysteine ligase